MADDGDAPAGPTWEGPLDEEGRPHGQGTMSYPPPPAGEDEEEKPGDKYTGGMVHGQRQGQGKYTWSSGASYEGQYEANQKQGTGTMVFPDKGKYEGEWEADKMQGQGTYTYPSGDVYKGAFEAGLKHGSGIYVYKAQACQFLGVWEAGQFVSGNWAHREGTQFHGSFAQSQPAQGTFFFASSGLCQAGEYSAAKGWSGGEVTLAQPVASN